MYSDYWTDVDCILKK